MSTRVVSNPGRILAVVAAVTWVAIAVTGWPLLDSALRPDAAGRSVTMIVIGVLWAIAAVATTVPAVLTLTIARLIVPAVPFAAAVAWIASSQHAAGAMTLVLGSVASVAVLSGDVGRRWVQSSAYGDEERFPLRAPSSYLVAAVVVWLLTVTTAIVGVSASTRSWIVAVIAMALTVVLVALGAPRWHRLARRWLVLVPAGVVVHDPLVLAETVMWRRHEVRGAALARVDTGAADLTGPASGHLVEVRLADTATVVLAEGRHNPRGKAIHLTAGLIAPTRPGAALAALRARGITR